MYITRNATPMGVDKNNVRTVVHLAPPASVEAYLQETGRASRDGEGAEAWLIYTPEDVMDSGLLRIKTSDGDKASSSFPTASDEDSSGSAGSFQPGSAPRAAPTEEPCRPSPLGSPGDAETIAASRRAAMIRYATSVTNCRREMLLEALGIESQDCTGCDICGGENWHRPPEEETILKVVRWNRGRFPKGPLARILVGRRTAEILRSGLDMSRGFGALSGWELEDAEEAIDTLRRTGTIRYRGWGSRKRIYAGRKKPDTETAAQSTPMDFRLS